MNTALYAQDAYTIGAADGDRRDPMGTGRRATSRRRRIRRARYFPTGTTISGLNVSLDQRRRADAVRRPRLASTRSTTRRSGTTGGRGQRRPTTSRATARPSPRSRGASTSIRSTPARRAEPERQRSSQRLRLERSERRSASSSRATRRGTARKYVGGEFGALANNGTIIPNPNRSISAAVVPIETSSRRGSIASSSRGVRGSLTYLSKREHDPTGTINVSREHWATAYTPSARDRPGRGRRNRHGGRPGDERVQTWCAGITSNQRDVNDDRLATRYDGLEATVEKRYERGFGLVAGYTYGRHAAGSHQPRVAERADERGRRERRPAAPVQAHGRVHAAVRDPVRRELPVAVRAAVHRTFTVQPCPATVTSNCLSQGSTTVNAEPRGSRELSSLSTIDLRAGRAFRFGTNRVELEHGRVQPVQRQHRLSACARAPG